MKHFISISLFLILFSSLTVNSQTIKFTKTELPKIRWADKVVNFSSQYSETVKSANQILGKPNAMPSGGDSPLAWAVKKKGKNEYSKPASIRVSYNDPIPVAQIGIAESINPGSIEKVTVFGIDGTAKIVYENTPALISEKARMLNIFIPKTEFLVKEIELLLQPGLVDGWNQIDAIGVCDRQDTILKAVINVVPNLEFKSKPENLGANINSTYNELAPIISPDGKTLFFVKKNHPKNIGGEKDADDIWTSTLQDDNTWIKAQNIGEPLNTKYSNYVQSVTPDGNTLLLGNVYNKDGSTKPGISISNIGVEGWEFPEKQNIEDFYNLSKYANYYLTNDNKYLIMAIERKDSYGDLDLYISKRKGQNTWSKPKNMGPIINTVTNDYSPFLAADGITLFYSTSGHAGYGKEDIYITKRLDDTWKNWSEPENLGSVINTPESDSKYNIPASGEYAYFSSTYNSLGGTDIFKVLQPDQIKPQAVVVIHGKVLSDNDMTPISAEIIYELLPEGKEIGRARTDPNTGEFTIILPAGKQYGFRAVADGYFTENQNLDLTDIDTYTEIEQDMLRLKPTEVGVGVVLNNIFFETAKAVLLPSSFPELNRVVEFMETSASLVVEIAGHTDSDGRNETNKKLSEKRARAVADYLILNGIDTDRLKVVGYGEDRPIAFNSTPEGKQKNRRVEFTILKK